MQELIDSFVADCKSYNAADSSKGWSNFLKEKCGIDIALTSSGYVDYTALAKDDTGAITGSDANITLESGEVIGTGVLKNKENIVPEYGNYYEAMTNAPQSIDTGSNGWMIKATAGNDTIISGGEDSINAGAGNNFITLKGSAVTVDAASGKNSIFIDNTVKSVTILNYNSSNTTLKGNTSVVTYSDGTAQSDSADNTGDAVWVEEELVHEEIAPSGDLPGNPIPIKKTSDNESSSGDVAVNAKDIINDGNDNYFNTVGGSLFTGSNVVKVDLTKAVDPSNPVPVGGFIVSGSNTEANFVSTNEDAKKGSLVGQVASVYPELMTFKFKGLTLNVKDRRYVHSDGSRTTLKTFNTFDDVGTASSSLDTTDNEYEKYVVASIYKWWMKEGLKLNWLNYGYSFEDSDATPVTINLHFDKTEGGSSALAAVWHSYYYNGKAASLDLVINKDYYKDLINYNDVDGGAANTFVYLDRTIAHEFSHAIMAAKDDYFAFLPKFIKEGMAEVTHGIDDKRTYSIQYLAQNADFLSSVINLTNEYTSSDYSYAGGYMLLRYLAKQGALQSLSDGVDTVEPSNPLLITLTENADTYSNTLAGATLLALAGDDKITNTGASVSVDLGAGNDSIDSRGTNLSINGGAGNDFVDIWAYGVNMTKSTILGGDGDDSIFNNSYNNYSATNMLYDGGAGNDYIQVDFSDYSTINGGDGNDDIVVGHSIDSIGHHNLISGGAGNDTIYTWSDDNTILSGDGNDKIRNDAGSKIFVDGGAGDDSIENGMEFHIGHADGTTETIYSGNGSTVLGGEGKDTLINRGSNVSINGGAGDDTIRNYKEVDPNRKGNVTITGGKGNDYIYNAGTNALFAYASGDGNDTIVGLNTTSSLQIGNGTATDTYSKSTVGSDIFVSVGSGVITLSGAGSLSTVNIIGKEVDTTPAGVKINNYTSSTSITSGAGNDTIYNGTYAANVTINTGEGNDSVYSGLYTPRSKISLGAGNDTFTDFGYYDTINGGAGNDLIRMQQEHIGNVVEYTVGDGDDTIYGFNPSDSLSLTGGSITGSVISGDDLILKIGTGSITFNNTRSINVNGTIFNPSAKTGTSGHDFLTNFDDNVTINALGGSDKIANSGSNVLINTGDGDNSVGNFGDNATIVTGNGNNTILSGTYMGANIIAGSGNDSIHTGWTRNTINAGVGNDTIVVHYASSITAGDGNDVIRDGNDGTTEDGISHYGSTMNGGKGNDTIYAYSSWSGTTTYEYKTGDGDDVIYGYGSTDTIKIAGNYSTSTVGNDVLITVDDGSILLKNAKNYTLNIEELKKESYLKLEDGNAVYYDGTTKFCSRFTE